MSQTSRNGHSGGATIQLTELEDRLRRLLIDVALYIDPEKPSQLRFTGGWVRDKLLGVDSKDIDVGIDNMTGYGFGLKMEEYLAISGNAEKHGLVDGAVGGGDSTEKAKLLGGLHKIEANPEKSKHLETVTTKVFGLDIDLVNLRKETYTEESRNPQMEFGTPEEDALRRDATINAMFFNLQTNQVEDFTRRGLEDLANGIIRTPLEPFQTFKDDPLRVLRLIRFASRYEYEIEADARECMKDETIREALRAKISRERVGVELEKMLHGTKDKNAHMALRLIDEVGLYSTIFTDPTAKSEQPPEATWFRPAAELVYSILESKQGLRQFLAADDEARYILWLLSASVPWIDAPTPEPPKGKKRLPSVASNVAREGIKASNKILSVIEASVVNLQDIIETKDKFLRRQSGQKFPEAELADRRDTLGMAVRRWGASWKSQAAFALLVENARQAGRDLDIARRYETFFKHIEQLGLLEAYSMRPFIDGTTLSQALGLKTGPWMKEALEVVMACQLRHPDNLSKNDAIQAVKEKHGELTTSLIEHFLQLTIRPLFSKKQTHNVTAAGHHRTVPQARNFDLDEDLEKRPWKKVANVYSLDLLSWVLQALSNKLTEKYWPLLVPPIFALLDDSETQYKAVGCDMVCLLMQSTPPSLLKRTGLGKVFEEAISVCLSYIPGLTPEDESHHLLKSAFPAMFSLYEVQYPATRSSDTGDAVPNLSVEHVTALNKLLHETILFSIDHFNDRYPKMVALLVDQMGVVLSKLGMSSISHLKDTTTNLTTIMTDPYVTGDLHLLESCVRTQQLVTANAWPRIYFWRSDMLHGIFTAWLRICEDERDLVDQLRRANKDVQLRTKMEKITSIKTDLVRSGKMIVNAICTSKAMAAEDQALTDRDELLQVDFNAELETLANDSPQLEQLRNLISAP